MASGVNLFILKLTTGCNLGCRYCSARTWNKQPVNIAPDDVLKYVVEAADSGVVDKHLNFLLHGGEPTLFPVEALEKMMIDVANVCEEHDIEAVWSMQSNCFKLSDAWIDLLKRFKVDVGASIDGPAVIHDAVRRSRTGEATYETVWKNVKRLLASGVDVSLLSVIDERHLAHETEYLDWILDVGLPVKMNPRLAVKTDERSFCAGYFQFLRKLYGDLLSSGKCMDVSINPIEKWLRCILFDEPVRECSLSGACGERMLCFSPETRVSVCGRMLDAGQVCRMPGNCGIREIRDELLKELRGKQEETESRCRNCRHVDLCHGGCVMMGDEDRTEWCVAASEFFDFMKKEALADLLKYLVERKSQIKMNISETEKLIDKLETDGANASE